MIPVAINYNVVTVATIKGVAFNQVNVDHCLAHCLYYIFLIMAQCYWSVLTGVKEVWLGCRGKEYATLSSVK